MSHPKRSVTGSPQLPDFTSRGGQRLRVDVQSRQTETDAIDWSESVDEWLDAPVPPTSSPSSSTTSSVTSAATFSANVFTALRSQLGKLSSFSQSRRGQRQTAELAANQVPLTSAQAGLPRQSQAPSQSQTQTRTQAPFQGKNGHARSRRSRSAAPPLPPPVSPLTQSRPTDPIVSRIDSRHLVVPTTPADPAPTSRTARLHGRIVETLDDSKRMLNAVWGWPLFWLSVLLGFGLTGVTAFAWLISMPPQPQCNRPDSLVSDRERLFCVRQQAESGRLEDIEQAINLVVTWPKDHPLYSEGQALIARWSDAIIRLARDSAANGNLDRAQDLIEQIPANSPNYKMAQDTRLSWERSWKEGQEIFDRVLEALKEERWAEAEYQTAQLSMMDAYYWRENRYSDAMERIAAEKEGRRKLKQAREAVKYEQTPQTVYNALLLISQIERQSFARTVADREMDDWSKKLLKWAIQRKADGDIQDALTAARVIPPESSVSRSARDLAALSQSELMLERSFDPLSVPISEQVLTLMAAKSIAEEMSPKHPLYRATRAMLPQWEAYIEDLMQLQVAIGTASVKQPLTFELAIQQAQQIEMGRPGRLHSQTLIASWQREIERIEDKPLVERARALAKLNTIDGYRAAIAEARKIPQNRGSWVDAQALIEWCQNQIEMIEDRPLIERAQKLINEGKDAEAIALLRQIQPGRALYAEARQLMLEGSQRDLLDRDRPILERAVKLASQRKYTEAIKVAESIPKDSPLYREAQSKIAEWVLARSGDPNRGLPARNRNSNAAKRSTGEGANGRDANGRTATDANEGGSADRSADRPTDLPATNSNPQSTPDVLPNEPFYPAQPVPVDPGWDVPPQSGSTPLNPPPTPTETLPKPAPELPDDEPIAPESLPPDPIELPIIPPSAPTTNLDSGNSDAGSSAETPTE